MSTTATAQDRCLRRDAAENRQRILDAAREAFALEGIDVSLIEIARRAGVGNATLHRNFTKESLVQALYDEWRAKRHAAAVLALDDPDPWRGLETFMTDTLEDASRNRTLVDMFMIRLHHGAIAGNPLARLMHRAQESGDLRRDAGLEDLFLMFWGIARTIGITGRDAPDQLHRQVAIALDGLRARPGQSPLPGDPVTKDQLDRLIGDWSKATLVRRRCS
jgi:AcrR family transcriptional regulator